MGFDPATLATVTFCALIMFAVLIAVTGMEDRQNGARLWWTGSFLLTALGFALTMIAPGDVGFLRDVVNVVFLLAYGSGYAGARRLGGRRPIWLLVVAGGAVWAVATATMTVSLPVRMSLSSLLICAYTLLVAYELGRRLNAKEPARRIAAWLCIAHATFYAVRLVAGPTFGVTASYSTSRMSAWGAALAFETMLFAGALSALVITALREREALQARALALTDKLTGIGNRRAFDTQARALIDRMHDQGGRVALLLMDIDGFKSVNDTFGHAAGDRLLLTVATMIRDCLPEPELFWRLGGDEFAVLLCDEDADRASDVADSMCRAVRESLPEAGLGTRTPVSVTIGLAFGRVGHQIENLMEEADSALYAGKGAGRDQVVIAGHSPTPRPPAAIIDIRANPVRPRLVHNDMPARARSI